MDLASEQQPYHQYTRLREQVQRATRDVRDVALLFGATPLKSHARNGLCMWITAFVQNELVPMASDLQSMRPLSMAMGGASSPASSPSPSLGVGAAAPNGASTAARSAAAAGMPHGVSGGGLLVLPFGSHVTGLAHKDSDLDVTVVFRTHAESFGAQRANAMNGGQPMQSFDGSCDHPLHHSDYATLAALLIRLLVPPLPVTVHVLGSSHCPRLRLRHYAYNAEADITFGNVAAVASSHDVQQYVAAHPSIVPFHQFLHALLRERQVHRNVMSSYVLTLTAIAFFRYHTKSIGSVNSLPGQALMYFLHTFGSSGAFNPATMSLSPFHPAGIVPRTTPSPGAAWVIHCPVRGPATNIAASCYLIFQIRVVYDQVYELLDNNYFSGSLRLSAPPAAAAPPAVYPPYRGSSSATAGMPYTAACSHPYSYKSNDGSSLAASSGYQQQQQQQSALETSYDSGNPYEARDGVNVFNAIYSGSKGGTRSTTTSRGPLFPYFASDGTTAGQQQVAATPAAHSVGGAAALVSVAAPQGPPPTMASMGGWGAGGHGGSASLTALPVCSHISQLVFPRLLHMLGHAVSGEDGMGGAGHSPRKGRSPGASTAVLPLQAHRANVQ